MNEKDFQKCITIFLVSFNELQKSVEKVLEAREDDDIQDVLSDFIIETIAFFDVNSNYIEFINSVKNNNENTKDND